jgi:Leucine Rich repeat
MQVTGLKLQNLYFKGCDIGPTGLAAICETQRTLIELDLSACARITDSALAILSANLPCLQFLSLQSCRSLTDVGISKLNQLKELRHINLQGLGTITANGQSVFS